MQEKVLEILKKSCPDIDFTRSTGMVTEGILDSISLVAIITNLSMELGIEIPYEEIIPENFNSVDAIVELAEKYS